MSVQRRSSLPRRALPIAILIASLLLVSIPVWAARAAGRIELGRLGTGATAAFVRDASGQWGLQIAGGPAATFVQAQPVQVKLVKPEAGSDAPATNRRGGFGQPPAVAADVKEFRAAYDSVRRQGGAAVARARIDAGDGVTFAVTDRWTLNDGIVSLNREVAVEGDLEGAGFCSTIGLCSTPKLTWPDVRFLAPSLLYGDSTNNGRGPGNSSYDDARLFSFREDCLPAPLMAVSLADGDSLTMLDLAPKGNSVTREGTIDERYGFGAFGANEIDNGGFEIGYTFPGTTASIRSARRGFGGGFFGAPAQAPQPLQPGPPEPVQIAWNYRCHPVKDGFSQSYQIGFRFATRESFPDLITNSYRWAWDVLAPAVNWHDIDVVRRSLADQLSSQVYTIEGRTGIPFIVSSVTGEVFTNTREPDFYWRAVMGFVGKNVEAADMLLLEAQRDPTSERGRKMRQQGLDIIATFIREVEMSPPIATGFNLKNGTPDMTNKPQWFIREATDCMRTLMEAYEREQAAGRDHPEWIGWCKEFADWCLTQQRPDGSFPRSYMLGTQDVAQESGATSYNVAPLFPLLTKHLGDEKYLDSALRAAEYVWQSYGSRGVFVGGAIDNPNITDKEAGMLSLEAFMSLYEATKDPKWLHRARVAGEFAATWMWIWNCPMPEDGDNEALHWKKGVPTIGGQGITAQTAGMIDQFLDYSVPAYAKLYKYTSDEHYLDIARILLHNSKAMLALPGRLYGMHGPGWQQEHWSLSGNRRGYGQPEKWMPWVTTNHLYGIYGLEALDPALFEQLATRPRPSQTQAAEHNETKGGEVILSAYAGGGHELTADPDSEFWRDAQPVFLEVDPMGEPVPDYRSEVRSRWTDQAIYFLFQGPYGELNLLGNPATTVETFKLWLNDVFEVYLGADHEHINLYREYQMSPQGEFLDLNVNSATQPIGAWGDWEWYSGMKVKARIDATRHVWYGEMMIPIASFDERPPQTGNEMRCNLYYMQGSRPRHVVQWRPVMNPNFHTPERFGVLRLVR